jgi:hypothetical protein
MWNARRDHHQQLSNSKTRSRARSGAGAGIRALLDDAFHGRRPKGDGTLYWFGDHVLNL